MSGPVVSTINTRPVTPRHYEIRIDLAKPLVVPIAHARLLEAFAYDNSLIVDGRPDLTPPPGDDGLVPFKSIHEIMNLLVDRTGHIESQHAVEIRLGRLSGRLKDAGIDTALIESLRGRRYRLRIRRSGKKDF